MSAQNYKDSILYVIAATYFASWWKLNEHFILLLTEACLLFIISFMNGKRKITTLLVLFCPNFSNKYLQSAELKDMVTQKDKS